MALTEFEIKAAKPRPGLFKSSEGGGLQLWVAGGPNSREDGIKETKRPTNNEFSPEVRGRAADADADAGQADSRAPPETGLSLSAMVCVVQKRPARKFGDQ